MSRKHELCSCFSLQKLILSEYDKRITDTECQQIRAFGKESSAEEINTEKRKDHCLCIPIIQDNGL